MILRLRLSEVLLRGNNLRLGSQLQREDPTVVALPHFILQHT
jgi:hypothetical protein